MRADSNIHTSIIIPVHNQSGMLKTLIAGLVETAEHGDERIELIIVDNQSDEPELKRYLNELRSRPAAPFAQIKIIPYPHEFNFAAINNVAASHSQALFLCFLNNDIEIIDNSWFTALHNPMQQACTGCVGAMLYYPDNTIQHAGVYLDADNIAGHLYKNSPRGISGQQDFLLSEQQVSAVTAACLLVRRTVFDQVGGYDEQFAVAFNDVDFCLKVQQAGFKNIWTPHAELYHHESKSRGQSHKRSFFQKLKHKKEVRLMKRRWLAQLSCEPHWSSHVDVRANASRKKAS